MDTDGIYNECMALRIKTDKDRNFVPGRVYLFVSSKRPGEFKIGLAINEDERASTGKTWLGDVRAYACFTYVDRYKAERLAHLKFSVLRQDGEWFIGEVQAAAAFLQSIHEAEAPVRDALTANVVLAVEPGLLSPQITGAPNTALQAFVQWKLPKSKVTAGSAIQAALSGADDVGGSLRALENAGLPVRGYDGVVLFYLTESSALVTCLDKAVGPGRWEHQLAVELRSTLRAPNEDCFRSSNGNMRHGLLLS